MVSDTPSIDVATAGAGVPAAATGAAITAATAAVSRCNFMEQASPIRKRFKCD
jgi:hypothetical protein